METSRISIRLSGVDLELTAELAIDVVGRELSASWVVLVNRLVSFQK